MIVDPSLRILLPNFVPVIIMSVMSGSEVERDIKYKS